MHVYVVVPRNLEDFRKAWCGACNEQKETQQQQQQEQEQHEQQQQHEGHSVVSICVMQTRALWQHMVPCLLLGPLRPAREMVVSIFSLHPYSSSSQKTSQLERSAATSRSLSSSKFLSWFDMAAAKPDLPTTVDARKLYIKKRKDPSAVVMLWLFPWFETILEYAWEERLIHWERQLILAQSLAGFYSTLGGGFFMTRHVGTALALAIKQQQMALFLNDTAMYYKCQINQAYDLIRCGKFAMARRRILQVQAAAYQMHDLVLFRMCQSALLFRMRVKEAALCEEDNPQNGDQPIDDYYRIRIIKDQSSQDDFRRSSLIPIMS